MGVKPQMPEAWRTTTQAVDHTMLPTVLQAAAAAAIAFNAKQVDSTPRVPLQPKKLKVLDAASDSSGMVSQQATKVSTKNVRMFSAAGKRDWTLPWHEILHLWNLAFSSIHGAIQTKPGRNFACDDVTTWRIIAPHCQTWMLPHHERVDMSKIF